jgi:hypothetical protein
MIDGQEVKDQLSVEIDQNAMNFIWWMEAEDFNVHLLDKHQKYLGDETYDLWAVVHVTPNDGSAAGIYIVSTKVESTSFPEFAMLFAWTMFLALKSVRVKIASGNRTVRTENPPSVK